MQYWTDKNNLSTFPVANISVQKDYLRFFLNGGFVIKTIIEEEPLYATYNFEYDIDAVDNELTFAVAGNNVEHNIELNNLLKNIRNTKMPLSHSKFSKHSATFQLISFQLSVNGIFVNKFLMTPL